ncbi:elongation factor P maturation arginine rhamnosyltransferase EarP [Roseateles sp. BYS87W]|uniref:Protein-arginine rhamnosyltransferase n=1 Tax=Pelomonas baiyunensis TaxID=3299026 RepID=A0ABW7GYD4_9BURK
MSTPRRWDIFCRVIDNHGDLGVCWRLARQVAARGDLARLWVDDANALTWMAPTQPPGVEVHPWPTQDAGVMPGEVVIEAFGCEIPDAFVARMAARPVPPRWINLEYLSAEPYVERSHGLASPQFHGPGAGLTKHFFYPGFTPRTGGLLREADLLAQHAAFDGRAWLTSQLGVSVQPEERVVSLFAYRNLRLDELLEALATAPTLLLACPGPLQAAVADRPGLRCVRLPYLEQDDYDRLLRASDLNFVRGEDSFVRAHWAGRPFVWHIYPQDDNAHHEKLKAYMDLAGLPAAWQACWRAWNGITADRLVIPSIAEAAPPAARWRDDLAAQPDLLTQLERFLGVSR